MPTLVLLIWVAVLYQKAGVLDKLTHRPVGEHTWAQTDRASQALSYYMDDAPLLLPRCHRAKRDSQGITAGEFPLIPYVVSKFYTLFGFDETYYRLTVLLFSLSGFLLAYWLIALLSGSYWLASASTSLWLASPNIILYSFSFMPDLPSLTFAVAAILVLVRSKPSPSVSQLLLFIVFASVSGLLKLTGLMVALSVSAGLLLYFHSETREYWKRWSFASIVSVVIVAAWVLYAKHLLHKYQVFTFLLEPLPPKNWDYLISGLRDFYNLRIAYYAEGFWLLLLGGAILALLRFKKVALKWLLPIAFSLLFFSVLFLALFEKSPFHMYYWLPFQFIILLWITWLFSTFKDQIRITWARGVFYCLVYIMVNYCAIHMHKNIKGRWKVNLENYLPYYDLETTLSEHGIGYESRVFTYPDVTPNTTLYLMNRKGLSADEEYTSQQIQNALLECDYAVLADTSILVSKGYNKYFYRHIAEHKGLNIYRLYAD